MTIAQLIDLLRSYGVDILILGAADALLEKVLDVHSLPVGISALRPFLSAHQKSIRRRFFRRFGTRLRRRSDGDSLQFAVRAAHGEKRRNERSRLARKTAPQRLHKGACPYGSGRKNLGGVFRGKRRDERRRNSSGRPL